MIQNYFKHTQISILSQIGEVRSAHHRLSIQHIKMECLSIQVYYIQPRCMSSLLGIYDYLSDVYGYVCVQLTKEGDKLFL